MADGPEDVGPLGPLTNVEALHEEISWWCPSVAGSHSRGWGRQSPWNPSLFAVFHNLCRQQAQAASNAALLAKFQHFSTI